MLPSEAEQGVLALVQVVQPSEAQDQFISWIHDITFAFYARMQPCDPLIPILLRDVITDTHHISRLDSNMTAATPVLDEYESDETTKNRFEASVAEYRGRALNMSKQSLCYHPYRHARNREFKGEMLAT